MISYPLSVVNILVSGGLIHIYVYPSRYPDWAPGIRASLPVTIFFLMSNVYLTIAPFVPPAEAKDNIYETLPYYTHCLAGLGVFVLGAIYWFAWAKVLPWLMVYDIAEEKVEDEDGWTRTYAVRVPSEKKGRLSEDRVDPEREEWWWTRVFNTWT